MAVYDRWHKEPGPGDKPCGCGRGRNRLYPSAVHRQGDRWQVRYRDPSTGKQKARNFALKEGKNPGLHADAFDAKIQREIDTRTYTDPDAGEVTLQAYAEQVRKSRTHGESAAAGLEARLRNHVYEGEPGSGKTPKGGAAIGQHPMGLLAQRPSLVAAWVAAMPLADSSRRLVIGDVSAVFAAAVEDGIVLRDPTKSKSVPRPSGGPAKAVPYSAAEVAGIAAAMPERRFAVVPYLGAGTGMREMEMAALGADDIVRGKRPKVRVLRQLKAVGGELRFGPVKNFKPHEVPVPAELLERLDAHLSQFPPLAVTLPWHEPGSKMHGQPVTVRLVLSKGGRPADRNVMDSAWRPAVTGWLAPQTAGRRKKRVLARGYGIHRLRHTFASTQLRGGIDVVRVAAWLGDTVSVVTKTYLHLMPDDRDGEDAGRAATGAFLSACALPVHDGERKAESGQFRAV